MHLSWRTIILLIAAWIVAFFFLYAINVITTIGSFSGSARSGSGGLVAISFSAIELLILVVPPLLLVVLKLVRRRDR